MNPITNVLILGVALHTIVGVITRTPEADHTPLRWKAWHSFLVGMVSAAAIAAVAFLVWLATGIWPPFWAMLLAVDLGTVAWKLRKHQIRVRQRKALQHLFDRPSYSGPKEA
ncbi:hypothetical protein [Streptomyces scabiei]|uniref:hypothetical protein n=1 Tax=Streptomyces scabiei TaxID=1930 RepID=UPI0038F7FF63